jgi:predicted transposase
VYRTISLRINPRFEEDKARLLKTMELYAKAYNISAEYGFATKEGNKIKNSMAVYSRIRNEIPDLKASLVQSACFMATEALRVSILEPHPRNPRHQRSDILRKVRAYILKVGMPRSKL